MKETSARVRSAPRGSTTPERKPYLKALPLERPVPTRGMEIIAPSGKFWMAIPIARAKAPAAVMTLSPLNIAARTTPTAIPSGRLWRATAKTSIKDFPRVVWRPSGLSELRWRWGIKLSRMSRKNIPPRKPAAAGSQAIFPAASAISIPGIISDHTEAATMTPEAKPRSAFWSLGFISPFIKKTEAAPREVPRKGSKTPIITFIVSVIKGSLLSKAIYNKIFYHILYFVTRFF